MEYLLASLTLLQKGRGQKKNWVFMKTMADHNCAELMSDPNSSMYEEEYDGD
ncbi:protein NinF [Escherichia coli]|uniref:protein NinF n=2 Tax=Escherichia coli TaxID=562 RepID=UPI001B35625A